MGTGDGVGEHQGNEAIVCGESGSCSVKTGVGRLCAVAATSAGGGRAAREGAARLWGDAVASDSAAGHCVCRQPPLPIGFCPNRGCVRRCLQGGGGGGNRRHRGARNLSSFILRGTVACWSR